MKRNIKGQFSDVLDAKAYEYIARELQRTDRGVPVKIATYLCDTYGISFLYAYQAVLKYKKANK